MKKNKLLILLMVIVAVVCVMAANYGNIKYWSEFGVLYGKDDLPNAWQLKKGADNHLIRTYHPYYGDSLDFNFRDLRMRNIVVHSGIKFNDATIDLLQNVFQNTATDTAFIRIDNKNYYLLPVGVSSGGGLSASGNATITGNWLFTGDFSHRKNYGIYGSDNGGFNTITNNTNKIYVITTPHYNSSAEENIQGFYSYATYGDNYMNFGGGHGSFNAATILRFYAGSNNTTLAGTEQMRITNSGVVIKHGVNFATAAMVTGTADSINLDYTPDLTLEAGLEVSFWSEASNTGATRLTLDGVNGKDVYEEVDLSALEAGDIASGRFQKLVYDGSKWVQISNSGN